MGGEQQSSSTSPKSSWHALVEAGVWLVLFFLCLGVLFYLGQFQNKVTLHLSQKEIVPYVELYDRLVGAYETSVLAFVSSNKTDQEQVDQWMRSVQPKKRPDRTS